MKIRCSLRNSLRRRWLALALALAHATNSQASSSASFQLSPVRTELALELLLMVFEVGIKLFFLAVRQLSKPIAGVAKQMATNSESLKDTLSLFGRVLHRFDLQLNRIAEGKPMLTSLAPLPEARAVIRGADVISEMVIYSIAGATVYYEYCMSKIKERAKEAAVKAERARHEAAAAAHEAQNWETHDRHRDELRHLEMRITLLQQDLQHMRGEKAATEAAALADPLATSNHRRRGWLW